MNEINIIKLALAEDIGNGDISAKFLVNKEITAKVVCRENALICGCKYFVQSFKELDKNISIKWLIKEGDLVAQNNIICTVKGNNKNIISAERVALNFLQTLSATATITHQLVQKIKTTKTILLDTRKTIPGLRMAQKEAVICGGGTNHRMGLYDYIMFKENHLNYDNMAVMVKKAKEQYPQLNIIIEVENLNQLYQADKLHVNRILCDNFSITTLKIAVNSAKTPLEASGNINKDNILDYAKTGVRYISIGSITKNIKAIDLSLIFC